MLYIITIFHSLSKTQKNVCSKFLKYVRWCSEKGKWFTNLGYRLKRSLYFRNKKIVDNWLLLWHFTHPRLDYFSSNLGLKNGEQCDNFLQNNCNGNNVSWLLEKDTKNSKYNFFSTQ